MVRIFFHFLLKNIILGVDFLLVTFFDHFNFLKGFILKNEVQFLMTFTQLNAGTKIFLCGYFLVLSKNTVDEDACYVSKVW